MEAAAGRRVRSGKEYDHLFPRPTGNDTVIKKSAEVSDTVRFIQEKVPLTAWQTEKFAKFIRGEDLEETCSKIWHFMYEHVKYKRDKDGVEQVRSPRRTWNDRHEGVDCDCFSVIISSTLINLGIPHKYRITKYPKRNGETPRWQHIYIVVPKDGNLNISLDDPNDYIVMDCVKDGFDEEEPYLEHKDFKADMRLDYLDGLEGNMEDIYEVPNITDAQDIADVYDEEELGKIGQWLKKTVKKVGTVVKKVADAAGDGIRFINRYANPATVLLRNGFLLAMKTNMMNVAKRLRYAYLSDTQAKAMGINLAELAKLRKIKDKAETVYWQAGGLKENLKKGILEGKGNRDRKVPLSGLDGLGNVYADQDEYNILHLNGMDGLGEVATGAALAAASTAVAAIAASLKQIKELFVPGAKTGENFQSDSEAPAPQAQPVIVQQPLPAFPPTPIPSRPAPVIMSASTPTLRTIAPIRTIAPQTTVAVPVQESAPGGEQQPEKPGFFKKAGDWIKENPGKTALIAGAIIGGTIYLKSQNDKKSSGKGKGLSGLPGRRKKKGTARKKKSGTKPARIKAIKIR